MSTSEADVESTEMIEVVFEAVVRLEEIEREREVLCRENWVGGRL